MKIFCYVYDSLKNPYLGGGGVYREVNIHKLLAEKYDITFFSGYFKGAKSYEEDNIKFRFLGFGKNYLLSRITFSIFSTFHSLLFKADLYIVSYSVYSPVFTFLFKRNKTIIQFYHFIGKQVFKKYKLFGIIPYLNEKLVLFSGKYFITMAEKVANIIKTKYRKIAIPTYTGIDSNLFNSKIIEKNYILNFGRIDVFMKGLDLLIDIFDKIAEKDKYIRLVIGGRGQEKDIQLLKNKIYSSKYKKRIKLILNPSYNTKLKLFKECKIVLIPSRFEGWNIVSMEAAANSKVVVASDIDGLSEAVLNNKTGYLCSPKDLDCFVKKVLMLLKNSKLRIQMGKNGYQRAKNFTWQKIVKLQDNLYKKVYKGEL